MQEEQPGWPVSDKGLCRIQGGLQMRGRPCDERAGQPASQDADHCPRASHSPLFLVREEHGEQELEIFPLLDRFLR